MKTILSSKILLKAIWPSSPNTNFDKKHFKSPKRRIVLQKYSPNKERSSTSGSFESKKCKKSIQYESQLELNFFILLESCKNVVLYGQQPLRIKYKMNDQFKLYHPDFYYLLLNGSCVIGEIKQVSDMGLYKNWAKWKAMKNYCRESGMGFLITDGKTAISDLLQKKINQSFRNEVMSNFGNSDLLEWDKVYELKEKYHLSMKDLACFVLQEKIKWFQKPSRFIKS